ncbi:MAG: glycosyltransferase [Deltaproteobacteria bacterium]|nr:MAG: glycosyltransferase [Deltaproteobacteria bacterium]
MDYHLLRHLKRREDLGLSAILLNEGMLADKIRELGIPVNVIEESGRSFYQLVRDAGGVLDLESPDILHSHRYKENILAYLSSRRRNGIRLVGTQHGLPESFGTSQNRKYRLLHRLNISLVMKSFAKVIAVSGDIRKSFIERFGFPGDRIDVIHNGTDLPEGSPAAMRRDDFVIGSMGRIFPVKDFPLMVEIAREVRRETDRIRFELAGDGPDRGKVQELVDRYGLGDAFRLRGFVDDLAGFYRGIDLYLSTSLHEGIPISVLDAMSHAIPVVAPNVGGMKEILEDGSEGYLVDGRDPKTFARKCLDLYRSGGLRQAMGSSARNKVEKEFSNECMANAYHRLYLEIARVSGNGVHA